MRPTTTVLATIKSEDFLYTCDGHLEDVNFASKIKVTVEEIAEVKREWEERQGKVKQGVKEQGKVKQVEVEQVEVEQGQVEVEQGQVEVEQGQVEVKQGQSEQCQARQSQVNQARQSQVNQARQSQVNQARQSQVNQVEFIKHEQYTLHRNFFSSKSSLPSSLLLTAPVPQAEHRRRREAAQARVLQVRLPRVPGR